MDRTTASELRALLGEWRSARGPSYLKLAQQLRDLIGRGAMKPGGRLPAERALAETLGVSRTTVVGAYETLRSEGLLASRRGSGTRVAGPAIPASGAGTPTPAVDRAFRGLIESTGTAISMLGVHLPALSEIVASAYAQVARELPRLTAHHGYSALGLPELRTAIAAHLTRGGLDTRPEQVLVTHGAQQAIVLAAEVFLRPGDAVCLEDPTYLGAIDVFQATGARLVGVPVGPQGPLVERIRVALAREAPRLLYLMPTYQNPVGTVLSAEARREIARLAAERGIPILEDLALSDLDLDGPPPPPLAAFAGDGPVLTAGSLSKLVWGGLRVGWLRAPEAILERLASRKVMNDLGNAVFEQAIAARLLARRDEILSRRRRQVREGYDALTSSLARLLPDWSSTRPSGGLSLWTRLPHGRADAFAAHALSQGVAVLPGSTCSPSGSFADHLRLPFGLAPEEIREAVERLARAWRSFARRPAARRRLDVVV